MKYEYETIQENEYLDIYRITNGVLLKVYKVKKLKIYYYGIDRRKTTKLFNDCYVIKEDIPAYADIIIKKGTIQLEGILVEPVNIEDYRYEIKTTGNALGGSVNEVSAYLNTINHLINKTQNPSQYEWENGNPEYMQGGSNGNN